MLKKRWLSFLAQSQASDPLLPPTCGRVLLPLSSLAAGQPSVPSKSGLRLHPEPQSQAAKQLMKIKSHHSPQKDRNPAEEGQRELEAPVWLRRSDEWKGVPEPAHEGQALKEV